MKFKQLYFASFLISITLFLGACGPVQMPLDTSLPDHLQTVKDLEFFPQNVTVYTNSIDRAKRLISEAEQLKQDRDFNKKLFSPWTITASSYQKKNIAPFLNQKPTGFKENQKKWTEAEWKKLLDSVQKEKYPSLSKPAIALKNLHMRALPTKSPYYTKSTTKQEIYPFDDFQYTSLPIGTPLFISHISKNKKWYFVESTIVSGWVKVSDIGIVDTTFMARYQNGKYAAIIKDKVKLRSTGTFTKETDIGTVLPIKSSTNNQLEVMFPLRNSSNAVIIAYAFVPTTDIAIKPLPLTPLLIAQIGNEMIGQLYGWGGLDGNRDCSSTMRDLFTPFGLWLPRNSTSQAKRWDFYSLKNLNPTAKTSTIKSKAVPFASLLWMQGHIGLYLGTYKGKIAYFHNIWGIRVNEVGQNLGRHILGRCVITSLEPGGELQNANNKTLINRIQGISTIPHADLY